MSIWTTTATLAFAGTAVAIIGQHFFGNQTSHPLPPGPSGLPWVGNIFQIDPSGPWKTYAQWARTYGDIVYARMLGKDIIILNSEKVAKDLLENRSKNYSDRPYSITNEVSGQSFSSIAMAYGDRWRQHRRFFHQTFRVDAVARFLPLQHRKSCHLLRQLIDSPEQLDDHVFEYTAVVVLGSTYDYEPESRNDELVGIAANVLRVVIPALRPDVALLLGAFPFLLHLPSWFPLSFKRMMAEARVLSKQCLERPFEYSLRNVSSSNVEPSMVRDALAEIEEKGAQADESWKEVLQEACATVFLAAAETSHSALMTFFLMIMFNPDIQERAQAQIDAVVGRSRLPAIEDRPLLPYLDAIVWETLRYGPVAPMLVPHAAVEDDVYEGFHIPKGAMILANVWSMSRDESRYPNANSFIPERFLNVDGTLKSSDVEHIAFGFGRRICVGRYFADTSLWAVIAKVLAVFTIARPLDENGVELPVEPRFTSGITIHPLPFKCRIVPRWPGLNAARLEELIAVSVP